MYFARSTEKHVTTDYGRKEGGNHSKNVGEKNQNERDANKGYGTKGGWGKNECNDPNSGTEQIDKEKIGDEESIIALDRLGDERDGDNQQRTNQTRPRQPQ